MPDDGDHRKQKCLFVAPWSRNVHYLQGPLSNSPLIRPKYAFLGKVRGNSGSENRQTGPGHARPHIHEMFRLSKMKFTPRNDFIFDYSISTLAVGATFPTLNNEWLSDGKSPQLSIKITHSLLLAAPAFHSWKKRENWVSKFAFQKRIPKEKLHIQQRLCWHHSCRSF